MVRETCDVVLPGAHVVFPGCDHGAMRIEMPAESGALVLLTLLVGAILGFAVLTDEVFLGETRAFDRRVLLALRDSAHPDHLGGPGWAQEIGRDFSALGGFGVLSLVTLAVASFELLKGRPRTALVILAAVGGALVLSEGLKFLFGRPRPDLVPHAVRVYSRSFPSGHSMLSAATYLTLAGLFARSCEKRREKFHLIGLAVLVTGLVGASRVYLGVHWPTDVLAGWVGGGAWAIVCLLVVRRIG